jgi:hypothetical protein
MRQESERHGYPDIVAMLSGTAESPTGRHGAALLPGETAVYQDWAAAHVRFPRITRRVRIYPQALQSTELSRSMRRQAAEREFRLLEGINHTGILKALDLHEHERGPALIFEHDPEAQRLDWFLHDRGETLDIDTRLGLVRQITETLQYDHEHRLYHRALSPQTLLVRAPASPQPLVKIFDCKPHSATVMSRQRRLILTTVKGKSLSWVP